MNVLKVNLPHRDATIFKTGRLGTDIGYVAATVMPASAVVLAALVVVVTTICIVADVPCITPSRPEMLFIVLSRGISVNILSQLKSWKQE